MNLGKSIDLDCLRKNILNLMKTKTILFYFAALLFISASCSNNEKLNEENITMANDQSMTTILNEEDECFNEKMDLWFVRFNQYQEEGFTMEEANAKAMASVAAEFKDCPDKATDKRIAKREEPSAEE